MSSGAAPGATGGASVARDAATRASIDDGSAGMTIPPRGTAAGDAFAGVGAAAAGPASDRATGCAARDSAAGGGATFARDTAEVNCVVIPGRVGGTASGGNSSGGAAAAGTAFGDAGAGASAAARPATKAAAVRRERHVRRPGFDRGVGAGRDDLQQDAAAFEAGDAHLQHVAGPHGGRQRRGYPAAGDLQEIGEPVRRQHARVHDDALDQQPGKRFRVCGELRELVVDQRGDVAAGSDECGERIDAAHLTP